MLRNSGLLLIWFFVLLMPAFGQAQAGQKILAVQSVRARPYDQALDGFAAALGSDAGIQRMIFSELPEGAVDARIHSVAPDLVLAIGMDALSRMRHIKDIPVVYVMVLDATEAFSGLEHITGVNMIVEPEKQLQIILDALPETRTLGLLYDPQQSGRIAEEIREAAAGNGVKLRERKIFRSENVPPALTVMKNEIDVFWMLPDLTVVTPETVNFLLLLTVESGTPIVTFADKYVAQGALMSIGVNPYKMGHQAGRMAEKILAGADPAAVPCQNAEAADIAVNLRIAEKLGISVDPGIIEKARTIR